MRERGNHQELNYRRMTGEAQTERKPRRRKRRNRIGRPVLWGAGTIVAMVLSFVAGRYSGVARVEGSQSLEALGEEQKILPAQSLDVIKEDLEDVTKDDSTEGKKEEDKSTKEELWEEDLNAADSSLAYTYAYKMIAKKHPEWVLVNKEHPLSEDYEITLKKLPDGVNQASDIAYDAMVKMLKEGRKGGLQFEVCSSYRSVARQQELLEEDIADLVKKGYTYTDAYEEVTKETMPPGYSEHATGLAFDIVALSYQMLNAKQEKTAENKWLRAHCAEYGFILRYPKDKMDVTQISYESWHFRYVGTAAAGYIMENDLTLEEFMTQLADGDVTEEMLKAYGTVSSGTGSSKNTKDSAAGQTGAVTQPENKAAGTEPGAADEQNPGGTENGTGSDAPDNAPENTPDNGGGQENDSVSGNG